MDAADKLAELTIPTSFADAELQWLDPLHLQCRGVRLRLARGFDLGEPTEGVVTLFKDQKFIRAYLKQLDGLRVDRMIEVGVWDGGSAIFFWNLFKPKMLSCIELKSQAPALTDYIDTQSLSESFRVHFGVDQSDRAAVAAVAREDFPQGAVDLIIDDASHLYAPSRATFEVLFPSLREGGLYVLEDWKTNLVFPNFGGGEAPDSPPLHQLVFELLDYSMRHTDVIPSVRCWHNFVLIERGPGDLLPGEFTLGPTP